MGLASAVAKELELPGAGSSSWWTWFGSGPQKRFERRPRRRSKNIEPSSLRAFLTRRWSTSEQPRRLKRRLDGLDYESYTDQKAEFVERVLRERENRTDNRP